MPSPWEADIELGQRSDPSLVSRRDTSGLGTRCMNEPQVTLWSWIKRSLNSAHKRGDCEAQPMQIEDYPPGYPRFSALIASHDSFHLCRRFSNLRARLLLLKQDRLSMLEKRLEKLDRDEDVPLRLGCSRRDNNKERNSVLSEIDIALADYDELVERNHRIFSFEAAKPRDVLNLQNWVNGNGCIARDETAYLACCNELLGVAVPDDNAVTWLETLIEDILIRLRECFGKRPHLGVSRDPNVHIFLRLFIKRAARLLMTPFIVTLLLAPVIICNCLNSLAARLIVIITAITTFIAVLSGLTKAKPIELVVAGATYITVLIVFISSTSIPAT